MAKVLAWVIFVPLFLLLLAIALVYVPPVQHILRRKAIDFLEEKIGTPVQLEGVAIRFPLGVSLSGLLVHQQNGDTLLYAEALKVRSGLLPLLHKQVQLSSIDLAGVRAVVAQDANGRFNFDYILDAFASGETVQPADTTPGWGFSIGTVELERVRLDLDLRPSRTRMGLALGRLQLDFDELDPAAKRFHVDELDLERTSMVLQVASTPPPPDLYPRLSNPFGDLDIRLGRLHVDEVAFRMKDVVTGDSLWLDLPMVRMRMRKMDLGKQLFNLKSLEIEKPVFGMRAASQPADTASSIGDPAWLDQHDGFRFWVRDKHIEADEVEIADGQLAFIKDSAGPAPLAFDPDHLMLKDVQLALKNLYVSNDSLGFDLANVQAASSKDGIPVTLHAKVNATPRQINVKEAAVELTGNRISWSAEARPGDLSAVYREPMKVPLELSLRGSLDPVAWQPYLTGSGVPGLVPPNFKEKFEVQLDARGNADRIEQATLDLDGEQGSKLALEAAGEKLLHWPDVKLQLDLKNLTMGPGFLGLARSSVPDPAVLPKRLHATLQAHMEHRAGNLRLQLASDLGDVSGTLRAQGIGSSLPDEVAADLSLRKLALGRFVADTSLRVESLKIVAQGQHLDSPRRTGRFSVVPTGLMFHGQDLSSLRAEGRVEGDSMQATVRTEAKALKMQLDAHGPWPAGKDSLLLAVRLHLEQARLQDLGFVQQELNVRGEMTGAAAMDSTGTGSFSLQADGLTLSNADRKFQFERFAASAFLGKDSTAVDLDSDALQVSYSTNMPVDSIAPRTAAKLATYFQADSSHAPLPGRKMDLEVKLLRSEWLTGLVVPGLQSITLDEFKGHYDSDKDELKLAVDIPELSYDSILVDHLLLKVDAAGKDLTSVLSIKSVERDSLGIYGLSLTSRSKQGALENVMRVKNGEMPPSYVLAVDLLRRNGVPGMHIQPDGLVLDSKPWTADPENLLLFTDQGLKAEQFTLRSDEQQVELTTGMGFTRISLTRFRFGLLLNFVTSRDSTAFASGEMNGHIDLPGDGPFGLDADVQVQGLHVLGTPLGDLSLKAKEAEPKHYTASVRLVNGKNTLRGEARVDASGKHPDITGKAQLDFKDLSILEPLAKSVLYELSGDLSGKVDLRMAGGKTQLDGGVLFTDTHIGLKATHSHFTLPNERIAFDGTGIHLDDFTLRDSLGNAFDLNGTIGIANLADPSLDLTLRTAAFQLVNSGKEDNKLFYGDVLAGLDLTVSGTANLPKLSGEVHVLDGTDLSIVLPGSEVKLVSHEGIVVFTNGPASADSLAQEGGDGKALQDSLKAQLHGFILDLHLLVDPQAKFSVVLDPTTGDAASFQGTGDLYFTYNASGDMTLTGPFTLDQGGYTLEFYGLVKKRFDLVKGSSVTWHGDPLDATMDIKAKYMAEAAPYGLLAGSDLMSQEQRNRLQERLPFEVIISVDGTIERPDIGFGIDLDRQYRNSYPQVAAELTQLEQPSSIDERNRQVFGLLVTNAFIPAENASAAPSSGLVSSAARNSVNGMLTDQLNKLTGKFVKGVDVSLGVNTVDQAQGNSTYQRTSVDYKVSKSFFNDRLSFEVGGSVGVDEQQENAAAVSDTRSAQYVVYYDLSKDGPFRLRGFYENAFDLYDGEITDSGIAIQYTKDFEENERARTAAREAERKRRADQRAKQKATRNDPANPATP